MASAQCACATLRAHLRALAALGLGVLLAVALIPHASAQPKGVGQENVTLEGSYSDVQFLAGRSVTIKANVTDDVFAAGRDVTFDNATVRNAIVAGYDVEQRGGRAADMIVAGANVTVGGVVEDDLVAAGRSLRVASGGEIGGDVRAAGETIEVEGRIGGSLRAAARRITISGDVDGKVDLVAERIVIGPNARIAGDLIYRSAAEPEIADGATIGGEIRRVEIEVPDLRSIGLAIVGIGIFIAVSWTIATLLLVAVVQLAFPGFMADAVTGLRDHPWSNLGRGIAILFVGLAVAGLLFASIVGVPLGGALMIAIALMVLLGTVTIGYFIGLFIRRRGPHEVGRAGRVGWAVLGVVILGLVTLVPFVGGIVAGLAVAAGFGAASTELWWRLRAA